VEIVAVVGTPTPPRRRRHGGIEQCVAPALASPRNAQWARRRLEKDVEAVEEDAARRAHRRKSTRAALKAAAATDKAAAVLNEDDTTMALVPACPVATYGEQWSLGPFYSHTGWLSLSCCRVYCSN